MAPRKPKPKAEPKQTEVAIVPQGEKQVVLEGDPRAQLAFAQSAATALMDVVKQKPNPVMIRGKQYLEFGDWQMLARFFGATVGTDWTKEILKDGKVWGYEARSVVHHKGEIISSAEGMCTKDEKTWKTRDDFAIKSMAQTRTAAKALRNAYGWVAELAGYASTPLEEMDGVPRDTPSTPIVNRRDEPFPSAPVKVQAIDPAKERKQRIAQLLKRMGHPFPGTTKEEADALVKKYTQLDISDENLIEIVNRLGVLVYERESAGGSPLADEFVKFNEPT